jgi:hypothetical protein
MLLVLKRSDQQEAALLRLMENQQYKKSSSYHQWLTPVDFGVRFGPSDADIAAVTNWLQSSGFQLAQVSKGRTVIEFSGTAGLVKQAFGTSIHKYVVKGEEHWANVGDPTIPAAFAPIVAGIDSLHNFPRRAHSRFLGQYSVKTKTLTLSNPEYTLAGCISNSTCYGVTPFDFATIYDLLPLWNAATPINGTGQTIAVVGETDINPADATTFWNLFGLDGVHAPQPTLTITHNGPAPGIVGDEGEADIDTQWSGAAAPGATINFVVSASTETTAGTDLSALYIVDNNLAPVMSESYGFCEQALGNGGVSFFGALWEQAAAQGITAILSAGDGGAAGCDDFNTSTAAQNGLGVSGFASTPFNVAVGGTDFNQFGKETTYWNTANDPITQKSAKGYIPETTWNDSCTNSLLQFLAGGSTNPETNCNNPNFAGFHDIVSGSGGVSLAWPKPAWQTGTGVPNDNARDLPDVSLFASNGFLNSFYIMCQTDQVSCNLNSFLAVGGTSVSAPAFAGIMAMVNQKWGPQGNANFVLYKLAAKPVNAFHDTLAGSTISVPCVTGSPNCTTSTSGDQFGVLSGYSTTAGYDRATGLGSVDAANLVNNWNSVTFTPTTTTLTLTASGVTHGAAIPVTVSVSPSAATGDISLLVSPGTPGNPGIDFATLANGVATGNTTLLPGGTYKIIAHYAGDGTYGGSYSAPSASVTVNAENSVVFMPGVDTGTDTLGSPVYSTSVGYGTLYLLRADVQNSAGKFCGPGSGVACPTGTIAFTDNGSALDAGTYALNSGGYTEDFAIQLPGGTNTLVAKYNGDPSYKSSPPTTVVVTITKAATHISNVQAIAVAQPGVSFSLSATVVSASSGVAPTGNVSFFANGALLPGTVLLTPTAGPNASLGALVFTTTINTPGNYNITATYTGDSNYAAVTTSNSFPMEVYDFTTSVPVNPLAANPGQSVSTTMMVTPVATGTFTNAVMFSCDGLTGVTCTFSPTTIAAGAGATNVTIAIQTAGPFTGIAGAARVKRSAATQRPWLPLTLPLAGIVLLGLAGRRLPRSYGTATRIIAGLALVAFLVSCGGGGSSAPPPVSISVNPRTVNTLYPNLTINGTAAPAQTQQFSAVVSGSTTQSVTWSVVGGNAQGTIDGNGLYSAPSAIPAGGITVTATAAADTTKSGSATVILLVPISSGTYPIIVSAAEGQLQKTTSFNLTVN